MRSLSKTIRDRLEETVKQARRAAETAARSALEALAVQEAAPYPHMDDAARTLRNHLRARARQLGDLQTADKKIRLSRIVHECAYEHWHRMLFARFLAENNLLIEPESGVAISLHECKELAAGEGSDLWAYASRCAQQMLPAIFRPDDPLLQIAFAREHRHRLEALLAQLEPAVFTAADSLGWVYQFWRAEEKKKVNESGDRVNADTLPAVTQLFTEHYMVEFLLHNTLGAWWTAKIEDAGRTSTVPLPYLRRKEDGTLAAGSFPSWPKTARELLVLDPCCGSGHFLVALLLLLVAMRREEEGLGVEEAVRVVLAENLHGLELDARCTQLAAFNVAFAGWKLIGRPVELPQPRIACSGLSLGASRQEWLAAVEPGDRMLVGELHDLFKKAPDLGSLINPSRLGFMGQKATDLLPAVRSLLEADPLANPEQHELGVTAAGLAQAAQILGSTFHLLATNVPYAGRSKLEETLRDYCETRHPDAKADLATCFVERCLGFCKEGGSIGLVTPQSWLFQDGYKRLRHRLLETDEWNFVARLGEHGFESPAAAGAFTALIGLSRKAPTRIHEFAGIDVSGEKTPREKDAALISMPFLMVSQAKQRLNPDSIVTLETLGGGSLLSEFAFTAQGFATSDNPPFIRCFWELPAIENGWVAAQSAPVETRLFDGRSDVLLWEDGKGAYYRHAQALKAAGRLGGWKSGFEAWGKAGVLVAEMRNMPATLYTGDMFDHTAHAVIPKDSRHVGAIWAFISTGEFREAVRKVSQKLNVTNETLVKVPFDLSHWQQVAAEKYPAGLPKPNSDDPTQWVFAGHPRGATVPLQVAVAQLLGYRWPRQTGSEFAECPSLGPDGLEEFADEDGIVCLSAIHGEASASDQLQRLLAAAYGSEWSPARLESLLADVGCGHKSLEDWLRDKFFEQHCGLFHQRPFLWQIWDGLPRGFSSLVNYHRLAAPNGAGRKLLEKLTYTHLGDWISRQGDAKRNGVAGADDRLAAALELKKRLEAILAGEPPFDLFARWKPLHQQPIGWEPDVNDGVRVNLRPFLASDLPGAKKGAGILRHRPGVSWDKADRGNEPNRPAADYPWLWVDGQFASKRVNDVHLTKAQKEAARAAKTR